MLNYQRVSVLLGFTEDFLVFKQFPTEKIHQNLGVLSSLGVCLSKSKTTGIELALMSQSMGLHGDFMRYD